MRIPSLTEMVNEVVQEGGDKITNDASKVEERLNLKLRRWMHILQVDVAIQEHSAILILQNTNRLPKQEDKWH